MRGRGSLAIACVAIGSALACSTPPALPSPVMPLSATRDEPFRARPPQLPEPEREPGPLLPDIQSTTLANGLTLWVAHRPRLPYVSLSFVARGAGTWIVRETPELMQLTSRAIVEGGMLWSDGRTIDPPTIHGQGVSFGVSPSHTRFSLQVQRAVLDAGLEVLSRTVRSPALDPDQFQAVQLSALNAILGSGGERTRLLALTTEGAYGAEFAARLAPLRMDEVRKASLDDVKTLYRRAFTPATSALIVVGDVTLAELLPIALHGFGDYRAPAAPAASTVPDLPKPQSEGRRIHWLITPEQPQAGVLILQAAPSLREREDELAFAALVKIAAGSYRSRAMRLRHGSGVTYGVHAELWAGPQAGLLAVGGDFEVEGVTQAITDLLSGFEMLREHRVSSDELERAKRALTAEFERSAATNGGLALLLGGAFAEGHDPEHLRSLRARISAITGEDLQRVARRYLQPENVEIGVFGPWSLANELSFIGRVESYNVAVE